jgi:1,4-alpha-glucan branching enzyme
MQFDYLDAWKHRPGFRTDWKEIQMLKKKYIKSRNVTKVDFELPETQLPGATEVESVHLAGEFNDWDPTATPMKRGKDDSFRVTLDLEPEQEYQFRYVANGEHWFNDWEADAYIPNGLGDDNCVVVAPAGRSST